MAKAINSPLHSSRLGTPPATNATPRVVSDAKVLGLQIILQQLLDKLSLDANVLASHRNAEGTESRAKLREVRGTGDQLRRKSNFAEVDNCSKVHFAHMVIEFRKERHRIIEQVQQAQLELNTSEDCPSLRNSVKENTRLKEEYKCMESLVAQYENDKRSLEAGLRKGRQSFEERSAEVQRQTVLLKEKLQDFKRSAPLEQQHHSLESQASIQTKKRVYQVEEEQFKAQAKHLRALVQTEQTVAEQSQRFLNKKIALSEEGVQRWTQRYDKEVGAVLEQLANLTDARDRLLDDIRVTEAEYEKELRLRVERNERQRLLAEVLHRNNAATRIQTKYRQYRAKNIYKGLKLEKEKAAKAAKSEKKKKR